VVLDVEARDVLARTGTWKGDRGPSVGLPLLLETGLPLSGSTEAVLVGEEPAAPEVLLVVRDLGSSLRPREAGAPWAHVEVPAEQALPPSLADALDEVPPVARSPGGIVEVVHGASSRMAGAERPGEGVEWTVMTSAAIMSRHPDRFVDAVIASRRRAGPARLLYLPGVATPRNMALLAYMGTDVVDDVMCRLEAARGRLVRPELGHLHGPLDLDPEEVEGRNLALMGREVALVREAVAHGALRELVEVRARSEPWQVAALRRLDQHHRGLLRSYCPVHRDRPLLALTRESLHRIEVAAWVEALMERYSPPPSAKVLLLLPCSARKPYSQSRTHRRLFEAMEGVRNRWAVHEVVLTSPLGAVPRELERMYPAAHYDIPVSGDWFPDEVERMRLLVDRMRAVGSYDAVVSHMGGGLGFLRDDPSITTTREKGEGALDRSALGRLSASVADAAAEAPRVEARVRKAEDAASIARVQFGRAATDLLMHGTKVEGRPPALRILARDGAQRGMVVPARGRISLTIEGASAMGEAAGNRVWMDDFDLRGDLFAVGVLDVDPGIRPGEEVAVYRGEELTAVGLARMASAEMLEARRGAAVAVRHKAPGGGGG
jgi:archaeosine synthase